VWFLSQLQPDNIAYNSVLPASQLDIPGVIR